MSTSKLATQVGQRLPGFYQEEFPLFVSFLEAYYEFMDTQAVHNNLETSKDLDETLDLFIESFKKDFAVNIPDMQRLSTREFLRNAKAFYTAKGTEAAFKFLFRAMYGKEIEVFYPETEMLRASDGRWSQEISCIVTLVSGDPFSAVGQRLTISSSSTSSIKVVKRVKHVRDAFYEIFFDSTGFILIEPGYTIMFEDFTGVVGYMVDHVVITKKGSGFRVGQIFSINVGAGTGAKIRVTRVDEDGGILFAKPVAFGAGYPGTTFYGTLVAQYTASTINTWDNQADHTLGTIDQGVIFNSSYAEDYSTGWEGIIYSSFFTENSVPEGNQTFDDATAANIEVRFKGLAKYPGYFETNNGFLSDSIKIQDSYYYQIYSYVLKLDEQLASYKNMVKALVHPAGMIMFGDYNLTTEVTFSSIIDILDKVLLLSPHDTASTFDQPVLSFIKYLVDSATVDESAKYTMDKVLADILAEPTESGSITITSPGQHYDDNPTEYYFDPTEYYNGSTTTEIYTW